VLPEHFSRVETYRVNQDQPRRAAAGLIRIRAQDWRALSILSAHRQRCYQAGFSLQRRRVPEVPGEKRRHARFFPKRPYPIRLQDHIKHDRQPAISHNAEDTRQGFGKSEGL